MSARAKLLSDFIAGSDWSTATRQPLAGDASRRRYERLQDENASRSAILMDAPPELGEDTRPFLKVGDYLRDIGLSAPATYASDTKNGFLIIEDFGTDMYDVVCMLSPDKEETLYDAAVDALIALAKAPPMDGLSDYRPQMPELAASSYRWYAEPIKETAMRSEMEEAQGLLSELISGMSSKTCTVLRDFHAQNLLWLPQREDVKHVGLLDFQDAMIGPVVYDLVSLVTDARRDVPPEIRERCEARFALGLGLDSEEMARDISICSAQRNLRILMVFGRMSLHFEKPHYVDLIPRVWSYLLRDLAHPDLKELRKVLLRDLPEPTPANLKVLKDRCGTVPTLQ